MVDDLVVVEHGAAGRGSALSEVEQVDHLAGTELGADEVAVDLAADGRDFAGDALELAAGGLVDTAVVLMRDGR
jgi:hypothetical protein